jgi:hypothetical protein
MSIITRIRALGLPEDQIVVIGGGLLDAYGLRGANDIDLVVTPALFSQLEALGTYEKGSRGAEQYLINDDVDIWQSWGEGNDFAKLHSSGVMVDGIMFVNPQFLIEQKRERGTEKDLRDIALLEGYLRERR